MCMIEIFVMLIKNTILQGNRGYGIKYLTVTFDDNKIHCHLKHNLCDLIIFQRICK